MAQPKPYPPEICVALLNNAKDIYLARVSHYDKLSHELTFLLIRNLGNSEDRNSAQLRLQLDQLRDYQNIIEKLDRSYQENINDILAKSGY